MNNFDILGDNLQSIHPIITRMGSGILREFDKLRYTYDIAVPMDRLTFDTKYVIVYDVPGVEQKDLSVSVVNGNMLKISYDRAEKYGDNQPLVPNREWNTYGIRYGKGDHSVKLPTDSDVDNISVVVKNGVLEIVIPRINVKSSSSKAIPVKFVDR